MSDLGPNSKPLPPGFSYSKSANYSKPAKFQPKGNRNYRLTPQEHCDQITSHYDMISSYEEALTNLTNRDHDFAMHKASIRNTRTQIRLLGPCPVENCPRHYPKPPVPPPQTSASAPKKIRLTSFDSFASNSVNSDAASTCSSMALDEGFKSPQKRHTVSSNSTNSESSRTPTPTQNQFDALAAETADPEIMYPSATNRSASTEATPPPTQKCQNSLHHGPL